MKQYRVSDVARADLDEIWVYIAEDNPDTGDRFIRAIVSRFPKLAAMPQMVRTREEGEIIISSQAAVSIPQSKTRAPSRK